MKLIYLAHPIRDKRGLWYHQQNIRIAEAIALELSQMGFAVICPGKNNEYFDGALRDEFILASDLEMLKRCDGVVMAPGWTGSAGAKAEFELANALEIPVYLWASQEDMNRLQDLLQSDAQANL